MAPSIASLLLAMMLMAACARPDAAAPSDAASAGSSANGNAASPTAQGAQAPDKDAHRPQGPRPSPRTMLPPKAPASPAVAALAKEVHDAIGEARCETRSECRTLAFGHRPCGGPERYLAWSTRDTDGARLEALAARHADARKAEDMASGAVSTCIALLPPGVACQARRCVLQPAPDALPIR